ncbi:MAG: ferrochelatase [Parvularculaceae bacterium]|nr:ferrochelatase [Parvularculaceae bacterium]
MDPTLRPAAENLPFGHPPVLAPRTGILLANLGTPDAPTAGAVRRYLAEFLSDRRVVDYPRAFWLPLLYGVILVVRPARTARNYKAIWRGDADGSPLRFFTRRQAELLASALGDKPVVDYAMRYGEPSIATRIAQFREKGVERLLVVPLYPQYSSSTTASVHDATFDALRTLKWQPALRLAPAFHDDPAYVGALARSLRASIASLASPPERVILSFHGVPERFLTEGDPYHCHCVKTARLLREALGWPEKYAPLAFQSRFGREKWLEPSLVSVIDRLAGEGVKRLAVATPGFFADCLETLEEIGVEARARFLSVGGENFDALPCLNDGPDAALLLETIARRETSGWTL